MYPTIDITRFSLSCMYFWTSSGTFSTFMTFHFYFISVPFLEFTGLLSYNHSSSDSDIRQITPENRRRFKWFSAYIYSNKYPVHFLNDNFKTRCKYFRWSRISLYVLCNNVYIIMINSSFQTLSYKSSYLQASQIFQSLY